MFPLTSIQDLKFVLPAIKANNVSKRAREADGFTTVYLNEGIKGLSKTYPNTNRTYLEERELFIKRHLAQYKKNKTLNRSLALRAWAYNPDGLA